MNGNKKTLLKWIGFGGFILLLTFAFKFGGFYYGSDISTALLAQEVKDNKVEIEARVGTVEIDAKIANKERGEHHTDIEVLKTQVTNVLAKVEAQTVAQNKTNDLLFQIVQRLPKDN